MKHENTSLKNIQSFLACRPGRFGDNCEFICHCEGGHRNCDKDGFCHGGCEAGWAGFTCQTGNIMIIIIITSIGILLKQVKNLLYLKIKLRVEIRILMNVIRMLSACKILLLFVFSYH